jgi:hypothetical protein
MTAAMKSYSIPAIKAANDDDADYQFYRRGVVGQIRGNGIFRCGEM